VIVIIVVVSPDEPSTVPAVAPPAPPVEAAVDEVGYQYNGGGKEQEKQKPSAPSCLQDSKAGEEVEGDHAVNHG
jgi:hypothetical protein